jgi:hypothetical protein
MCDIKACKEKAVYGVGLLLACNAEHTPAMSSIIVRVCEEHKLVKWDELVNDEGWAKICNNFLARGLAIPLKNFSKLYTVKI